MDMLQVGPWTLLNRGANRSGCIALGFWPHNQSPVQISHKSNLWIQPGLSTKTQGTNLVQYRPSPSHPYQWSLKMDGKGPPGTKLGGKKKRRGNFLLSWFRYREVFDPTELFHKAAPTNPIPMQMRTVNLGQVSNTQPWEQTHALMPLLQLPGG